MDDGLKRCRGRQNEVFAACFMVGNRAARHVCVCVGWGGVGWGVGGGGGGGCSVLLLILLAECLQAACQQVA